MEIAQKRNRIKLTTKVSTPTDHDPDKFYHSWFDTEEEYIDYLNEDYAYRITREDVHERYISVFAEDWERLAYWEENHE